ncbi:hypothetical protein RF55_7067 [Lasius niger]|uniref:Uncharacterized protein n=1 Tax=Lasius niger TaxID=67767 RepID=A0A0J7KRG7_LASNI|nr:hypothetical protein RF55_7067 [Lasius niger]
MEEGREMLVVKIKSEEQRKEVLVRKKHLMGRKERIMEDWTWRERKMRWRLEEIAREEERSGRRVWMGYGKIDEIWWKWDEEKEVLRDGRGNVKRGGQGKKEKGGGRNRLKGWREGWRSRRKESEWRVVFGMWRD